MRQWVSEMSESVTEGSVLYMRHTEEGAMHEYETGYPGLPGAEDPRDRGALPGRKSDELHRERGAEGERLPHAGGEPER